MAAFAFIGSAPLSLAQTWIKPTGTGNWNDAANWGGSIVPSGSLDNETRLVNGNAEVTTNGSAYSFFIAGSAQLSPANATITVRDGGTLSSSFTYLGYRVGANGTANVVGSGSAWTNLSQLYVGISGGMGNFNVTQGGILTTKNYTYIGYGAGSNGNVTVSGPNSLWSAENVIFIGAQGSQGSLTVENGGTVRTGSNGAQKIAFGYIGSNTGTVNIGSGGAAGYLQSAGLFVNSGSSGKLNFNHNESAYSFGSSLEGNLAVEQKGSGTTVITGNLNTYTGGTTVTGGKLVANNTAGSAFGSGSVVVNASATLAGTGRFTGAATILGTFAPGNSVGNLSTGSLTIGATGIYEWEMNKANGSAGNSSGGWDLTTVTGNLLFEPGATLGIESLGLGNQPGLAEGFDNGASYTWTIATATGTIGGWENLTIDSSGFQNPFTGSFSLSAPGNLLLLSYTPVPEPTAAAVFASGLLMLAGRRRRCV